MTIRIKDPMRAVISASEHADLSDEVKLGVAAWLISEVARKLGVDEVELVYEPAREP